MLASIDLNTTKLYGVPMVFREVFPPVEDRPPFFLRPRGTALVVRLAVCCFWPAIAPDVLFRPKTFDECDQVILRQFLRSKWSCNAPMPDSSEARALEAGRF